MSEKHVYLNELEPSTDLSQRILTRVAFEKRRAARLRFAAFLSGFVVSGFALVPALSYAMREFYASGFYDYLSLFFSDSGTALSHWQELSLSLVESLPSLALLLLLTFSILFAWTFIRTLRSGRSAFTPLAAH